MRILLALNKGGEVSGGGQWKKKTLKNQKYRQRRKILDSVKSFMWYTRKIIMRQNESQTLVNIYLVYLLTINTTMQLY